MFAKQNSTPEGSTRAGGRLRAKNLFRRMLVQICLVMAATGSQCQQAETQGNSSVRPAIVDVADQEKDGVVQVHAVAGDGMEAYGTGFLITNDGIVVTSADVIRSAKEIKVSTFADTYSAELLLRGAEPGSIAILATKLHARKLRIASHEANIKDQVSAIGWEPMPESHLSSIVGSIVDVAGNRIYYSRNSDGRPGYSGGPLINEQGEVIGVNIGAVLGSNVAWALNLRSQMPVLKKFAGLSDEREITDTSLISSAEVSCEAVEEQSRSIEFHLQPDQQIVDASVQIVEQFHVAAAKVSIEKVAGSSVIVHSWLQGPPRSRVPIFGLSIGPCDVGHVSILVHARIAKSADKH